MIDLLTARPQTKRELAEKAGTDTRTIEEAIRRARLEGVPIASSGDGYFLTDDPARLEACYRWLRSKYLAQARTAWALRKTARRLAERAELTLFGQDIAA